jgi:hypothetical protein
MSDGFDRSIVERTAHRPWPMPSAPWLMTNHGMTSCLLKGRTTRTVARQRSVVPRNDTAWSRLHLWAAPTLAGFVAVTFLDPRRRRLHRGGCLAARRHGRSLELDIARAAALVANLVGHVA